jgi:large subunit ribosomal protein L1
MSKMQQSKNKIIGVGKGGKKLRNARVRFASNQLYTFSDAVELLKGSSFVSFDPTVELVVKLGIDVKRSDQVVRGMVSMPSGTGKNVRVAVICKDDKFAEAKSAGADIVGNSDLIEEIKKGVINFDVCIASPDMMGSVGQVAKILGPKGLMPNPKLGTVTANIAEAVKNSKAGQVEFRADKGGIIHAGVGKLSFSSQDLFSNVKALFEAVVKAKPAASKGVYVKGIFLSSTMAPAAQLQPNFLE